MGIQTAGSDTDPGRLSIGMSAVVSPVDGCHCDCRRVDTTESNAAAAVNRDSKEQLPCGVLHRVIRRIGVETGIPRRNKLVRFVGLPSCKSQS